MCRDMSVSGTCPGHFQLSSFPGAMASMPLCHPLDIIPTDSIDLVLLVLDK
jgi:hypothetical protein